MSVEFTHHPAGAPKHKNTKHSPQASKAKTQKHKTHALRARLKHKNTKRQNTAGGQPLSPGLDNSTGNSTATRQLLDRIARQSLTATRQTSTATRQKPPDSMRLGVKVSSSTARQLDRPRQNSTDLDRAEPIRTSLLEPHSFKVKVDGDPLVNYTTWWLDDGFTSGGPFVPRVRFVRSCSF